MKALALALVVSLACAHSPPTTTLDPSEAAVLAKAYAFFEASDRPDAVAVFGDADRAFETFNGRADRVDSRVAILVRFVACRN